MIADGSGRAIAFSLAPGQTGKQADGLRQFVGLSGLMRREPLLAVIVALGMMSLIGFPPSSGFLGKVGIARAAADLDGFQIWLVLGALLVASIGTLLTATRTGVMITTAYIERLNATFRSRLSCLTRRGRALAHTQALVNGGMWLVGGSYNFCTYHASLREHAPPGVAQNWESRTPAMAAGLTDHCWTVKEVLLYQVPPPPWVAPRRRGRPPKSTALPPGRTAP